MSHHIEVLCTILSILAHSWYGVWRKKINGRDFFSLAFKIKGQTKAASAIDGIYAFFPDLPQILPADSLLATVCSVAFDVKGQTKALAAFLRYLSHFLPDLVQILSAGTFLATVDILFHGL